MSWCVYRHTSPSGKIYIGISSNVNIRWSGKGFRYTTYNSIFKKAIKKYGWDNIKHEILFKNLTKEKASQLEIDLIRHYKNLGISYNITNGGEGTLGRKVSEETKQKMRENAHGFSKNAIIALHNSRRKIEAAKRNILIAQSSWKGKHHTDETKKLMSQKAKGRDMTKAILAQAKKKAKKVLVISPLNEEIIYNSMAEAANAIGSTPSNISRAARHSYKVKNYKIYNYELRRI